MPPRIITARSIGLRFRTGRMGKMGPEQAVVGHYSGHPRASHFAAGIAQVTAIHKDHLNKASPGSVTTSRFPTTGRSSAAAPLPAWGRTSSVTTRARSASSCSAARATSPPTRRRAPSTGCSTTRTPTRCRAGTAPTETSTTCRSARTTTSWATACPGLCRSMLLRHGEPFVEGPADSGDVAGDGFVEPTVEDQERLAAAEAGDMSAPEAEAATIGPDQDELRSEGDDATELPEADPDFDEDLSDLLADIEAQRDQMTPR